MNASRLLITTPVALGDKNCYLWPAQSTRQQQQQQQSAGSWAATKARIKQHCCCYCCCRRPPARPSPSPFPPSLIRSRLEIAFLHGIENCKNWKKIDSVLHTNMMAVTTTRSGNNNITATTTTTDREREREREKGDDRAQWKRRQTKRARDSRANLLPAKICYYFHHLPILPILLPIKKTFPGWTKPKLKSDFLLAALVGQQPKAQKWSFTRCPVVPTTQCSENFLECPEKYFISVIFICPYHNCPDLFVFPPTPKLKKIFYSLPQ